jgi:Uma2 family endonuclease
VLDVEERERKSWVVWQEGMRFPDLIIELLYDSTREVDQGEKKALYERMFRTQEYYLYDPFSQEFLGYHLQGIHYQERQPDAQRQIYSVVTGLYVGIREGWLRWLTTAGVVVPTPREWAEQEHQRAEQATQRAEQATQRAEQAEQLLETYRRRFGHLEESV